MNTDIIYINPRKIKKRTKTPFDVNHLNLLQSTTTEPPIGENWDITEYHDIETEYIIYKSLFAMINNNVPWEKTELYSYMVNQMNMGTPKWLCNTIEACINRGKYLTNLYENIKSAGNIMLLEDLEKTVKPEISSNFMKYDDIYVSIDANGEILFANNGSHRFCIARILGFNSIPVRVYKRHNSWIKYKNELYDYCRKNWNGKVYQTLPHPDLSNISPTKSNKRFELIKSNTTQKNVRLLDIGSLFGHICYEAELEGYQCTAVEINTTYLEVMRKLRFSYNMNYEILDKNIFDIKNKQYEIVVAFNIFHHFIKNEQDCNKLVQFLNELDYKEMFVQFHRTDEAQMVNAFRNFNEEEFANFIIKNSKNKTSFKILDTLDGRTIAKIY
jgi:2-polyprenyl-3-methyl-5-hydroxy-6-metoxy-1,4-benzoquinol methylase